MTKPAPRLSVVIPVFNGEPYLAEAIRSVLDQDYDDLEVIVVDDGSTDGSSQIARQFPGIRLVRQQNGGVAVAHNAGVSRAWGELVAFLDADDVWEPGSLAGRVGMFDDDPNVEMTHGLVVEFISPGLSSSISIADRNLGTPIRGRLCGATMVRRTALDRVGPMNPALRFAGWMDWLMRADEVGLQTEFCEELVLHRRIHGDNLTIRLPKDEYVKLLKGALDRRRRTEE
ncbi:MAG TPA: glycosyltransferase family A protein [Rhodothermales bacterium]|nr:glycosyltransferase family A protein [Rhodothermales bacterium]